MAKSFGTKNPGQSRSPASMGKRSGGKNILSGGAPRSGANHTVARTASKFAMGQVVGQGNLLPANAQGSAGPATMVSRGKKAGDAGGLTGVPVANTSFRPASKT